MKKTKFKVITYGTLLLSTFFLGNQVIWAANAKNPLNPSQEVEPLGPAPEYEAPEVPTENAQVVAKPKAQQPTKVVKARTVKKVTKEPERVMLTDVFKTPAAALNPRDPLAGGGDDLVVSDYWSKVARSFSGKVIIGQVASES